MEPNELRIAVHATAPAPPGDGCRKIAIISGFAGLSQRPPSVSVGTPFAGCLDLIRHKVIIETQAEHLLDCIKGGTVSTNVHLRKLHNFCLSMNWLPWPLIPRRLWPEVRFQPKRAITFEEHQLIIEHEKNPERGNFYELCWHLGGSQSDIASLKAEDVDWPDQTIAYARRKTGSLAMIHFGPDIEGILRRLPATGPLFPYLSSVRPGDRATEFHQRCVGLGIKGVSLHSYRYAWAERAKQCG